MPRRNARYAASSLNARCPPAWIQKTTAEILPALATKAGTTTFITDFLAVVANHRLALPNAYVGLIQDGNVGNADVHDMLFWLDRGLKSARATMDGVGYDNRLSEMSGWGEATPDLLSEADPLDLVTTLEALGIRVVIVDHDAVADAAGDAADATKRDTVVRIPRGGASDEPCTTLAGTAKSYNDGGGASDDLLNNTTDTYRYRFWKTLVDLNERSGSRLRFPDEAVESMVLVRNTVSDHIVNVENQIGCTMPTLPSGQTQNTRITLRGYPGEWPEIWCGNSTDDDAAPTECPWDTVAGGLVPNNGTATIFRIGQASDKYRDNFHIRNIHFHGKRETAGGDWIFCGEDVVRFDFGTGCSVRFCKFTDLNPLPDNDTAINLAAADPTVIDFANSVRSVWTFNGLTVACDNFTCDSNYFEGVDIDDYPNASNSSVATITISDQNGTGDRLRFVTAAAHGLTSGTMSTSGHTGFTGDTKLGKFAIFAVTAQTLSVGNASGFTGTGGSGGTIRVPPSESLTGTAMLDVQNADNVTVTRNQFRGLMGNPLRVQESANTIIEDNIIEGYDGTSLYVGECTGTRVRRNRIGPHGSSDYALSTASHGIQVGYSSDVIIEDNVIFSMEPTNNVSSYGIWVKALNTVATENVIVRRNLLYRNGLSFDNDGYAAATISNIEFSNNLVVGMTEMHKTKLDSGSAYQNAPIRVNFLGRTGNVAGTLNGLVTFTDNQFWRFANATPNQSTIEDGDMMAVRNTSAALESDYYGVDDTLTGWTGNTTGKPDWVGNPEWVSKTASGDFRMTTDPIGFTAGTPFTEALSRAWEPD